MCALTEAVTIINYLFAKKYQLVALHYSNTQLINTCVMILEIALVVNPTLSSADGYSIAVAVYATFSLVGYNSAHLGLTIIFCCIYFPVRTAF